MSSTNYYDAEPSSITVSSPVGERHPEVEDPRRLWNSDSSHGSSMATSSQRAAEALSFYSGKSSEFPPDQTLPKSRTMPPPESNNPSKGRMGQQPLSGVGEEFQGSRVHASRKASARGSADSGVLQGEEVRLDMDSLAASHI